MTIGGVLGWALVAVALGVVSSLAVIRNWPNRAGVIVGCALCEASLLAIVAALMGTDSGLGEMRPVGAFILIPTVVAAHLAVWAVSVGTSPKTGPVRKNVWAGLTLGAVPAVLVASIASIAPMLGSF